VYVCMWEMGLLVARRLSSDAKEGDFEWDPVSLSRVVAAEQSWSTIKFWTTSETLVAVTDKRGAVIPPQMEYGLSDSPITFHLMPFATAICKA
jgi:hypothetical protein